jgi:hypothetical protein
MVRKKKIQGSFSLAGKTILCSHCQGDEFIADEAQLNTALMTLIELDWLNKSAAILTCTSCGQVLWFRQQPARIN